MDEGTCQSKRGTLEAIKALISADPALSNEVRDYPQGITIFKEGENYQQLLLILEGKVILCKAGSTGDTIQVDHLEGQLLGIISYMSRRPVYVSAIAESPVRALALTWEEYELLHESHPELYRHLHHLTEKNLALRYRRVVQLHLDIATVNRALEVERAELRATLSELKRTRNRLIHQEKLATLGQLIAGLAHELNNPVGALVRSVEYLRENVGQLIGMPGGGSRETAVRLWEAGLKSETPDSNETRRRMDIIRERLPSLSSSVIRRLSILSEEALSAMFASFEGNSTNPGEEEVLAYLLPFEAGYYLRSIGVGAERIGNLVVSLRNYSRGVGESVEEVDIRAGINDTLRIVGNRIRDVDTELRLDETPVIQANSGELNQVWTNLIVNACDAMNDEGRLAIACGREGHDSVFVSFADSGPGIPEDMKDRIFEPNFTTKTNATHFGLGLGLAISREIIRKYGGELTAENAKEGGAVFRAVLPVSRIQSVDPA